MSAVKRLSGFYVTLDQWAKATEISLPTARRRAAESVKKGEDKFVKMGSNWIVRVVR